VKGRLGPNENRRYRRAFKLSVNPVFDRKQTLSLQLLKVHRVREARGLSISDSIPSVANLLDARQIRVMET
jgi:hypothetical protein